MSVVGFAAGWLCGLPAIWLAMWLAQLAVSCQMAGWLGYMTTWLVAGWLTMQPVDLATGFNKKKRSPQTKLIVVGGCWLACLAG